MNKTISILFGLSLAVSVFGGESLKTLSMTIATEGPDYYSDGTTPVKVGETYLLVYIDAGQDFMGVRTDGSLVRPDINRIATTGTAVEGARCGFKAVQFPAADYPSGGSWALVLLDTRDSNGDVGGLIVGRSAVVSGVNKSRAGNGLKPADLVVTTQAGGLKTGILTPAPSDTPDPMITGVEPNGVAVGIRIKNFTDKANYEVQTRTALGSGAWEPAVGGKNVQAKTHGNGAEMRASVTVPADDTVRFFRVIVPGGK